MVGYDKPRTQLQGWAHRCTMGAASIMRAAIAKKTQSPVLLDLALKTSVQKTLLLLPQKNRQGLMDQLNLALLALQDGRKMAVVSSKVSSYSRLIKPTLESFPDTLVVWMSAHSLRNFARMIYYTEGTLLRFRGTLNSEEHATKAIWRHWSAPRSKKGC